MWEEKEDAYSSFDGCIDIAILSASDIGEKFNLPIAKSQFPIILTKNQNKIFIPAFILCGS
jgi:hypothetical protein